MIITLNRRHATSVLFGENKIKETRSLFSSSNQQASDAHQLDDLVFVEPFLLSLLSRVVRVDPEEVKSKVLAAELQRSYIF